jgi:hypothetical protein
VTIRFFHGFNTKNGDKTVNRFIPTFEAAGFHCAAFTYGWTGLLGARLNAWKTSRQIAALTGAYDFGGEGEVAIAHSHGCKLVTDALFLGATFREVVFIDAALDVDTVWPKKGQLGSQLERINVLHVPGDLAVEAAALIPFSPWGRLGSRGYTAPSSGVRDNRVKNWNASKMTDDPKYFKGIRKHSRLFNDPEYWAAKVVASMLSRP